MDDNSTHQIFDDIVGRLRNTRLPKSKALLPVFEAIVNSIQALDDVSQRGSIRVKLLRARQTDFDDSKLPPITDFEISDDGPGFSSQNYQSFCTADSRLKESAGGKGIGRFIWLKAFQKVQIDSIYSEEGELRRREFAFLPTDPPIRDQHDDLVSDDVIARTIVRLTGLDPEYSKTLPTDPDELASKLTRHLLIYLLNPKCPEIVLDDELVSRQINLNHLFSNELTDRSQEHDIEIRGHSVHVRFLRVLASGTTEHSISLCADQREVCSYPLHKPIPNARNVSLENEDGERLEFKVVVGGQYLDSIVNPERTGFLFADADQIDPDSYDLTLDQLLAQVGDLAEAELRDQLDDLERRKIARIEQFVREKEPEYRVLLKHAPDEIARIAPDLPDNKLDQELHRILHVVESQIKEEGREFLGADVDSVENRDEYVERYRRYVDKLLDYRSSELAKYVIHRRTIIELLGKAISLNASGDYSLEEDVHRILYPPRTTSDEVEFGQQNLWLIDEKLTYHYFLASDTAFGRMQVVESDSRNRPDILVFNQPSAFTEGEYPLQSVVIIELKRPERSGYDEESDNPFTQIYTYIEDLRAGKVLGPDGQHVQLGSSTRFYCYIIADATPKFRQLAKRNEFFETPDELGFYKFSQNYNAYVEVITYRKLFEDAKKRNRVLFEKLALPGYENDG